ncbi:MAG: hypothetical protein HQM14_22120, partial [SAR324 cluster bacterium]|nr:hypothetical protein [SAR324 cluster bacterium]
KAIQEAGLYTIVQLVIGMPGETNQTIKETSEFACKVIDMFVDDYKMEFSINYAQALPGTPLFEYARFHEAIGTTIDEEEKYLLKISNVNASHIGHYLHLTEGTFADAIIWRDRIRKAIDMHYHLKLKKPFKDENIQDNPYFTFIPHTSRLRLRLYQFLGELMWTQLKIKRSYQYSKNIREALKILFVKGRPTAKIPDRSLRKIMKEHKSDLPYSEIQPLREGR